MVFDTGSDWLVVESNACSSCIGKTRYYQSDSYIQLTTDAMSLEYGSASIAGVTVKDDVCVGSLCSNFEWFLIKAQKGLPSDCSGIIGMSRAGSDEFPSGPRFFQDQVFSFHLSDQNGPSFVDIG